MRKQDLEQISGFLDKAYEIPVLKDHVKNFRRLICALQTKPKDNEARIELSRQATAFKYALNANGMQAPRPMHDVFRILTTGAADVQANLALELGGNQRKQDLEQISGFFTRVGESPQFEQEVRTFGQLVKMLARKPDDKTCRELSRLAMTMQLGLNAAKIEAPRAMHDVFQALIAGTSDAQANLAKEILPAMSLPPAMRQSQVDASAPPPPS